MKSFRQRFRQYREDIPGRNKEKKAQCTRKSNMYSRILKNNGMI